MRSVFTFIRRVAVGGPFVHPPIPKKNFMSHINFKNFNNSENLDIIKKIINKPINIKLIMLSSVAGSLYITSTRTSDFYLNSIFPIAYCAKMNFTDDSTYAVEQISGTKIDISLIKNDKFINETIETIDKLLTIDFDSDEGKKLFDKLQLNDFITLLPIYDPERLKQNLLAMKNCLTHVIIEGDLDHLLHIGNWYMQFNPSMAIRWCAHAANYGHEYSINMLNNVIK